jgi:hypothetical protein
MKTTTPTRPVLDEYSAWIVQQVADAEHRSFSNALQVLVDEAWKVRRRGRTAAAFPEPKDATTS